MGGTSELGGGSSEWEGEDGWTKSGVLPPAGCNGGTIHVFSTLEIEIPDLAMDLQHDARYQ